MLRLTKLNGEIIYVNYLQILYLEEIPETKVKLTNGEYYLVRDSVAEIQRQIQHFLRDTFGITRVSS